MSQIHPEDPRITAHVLGEATEAESLAVREAAVTNSAVRESIEETRQLAACLGAAFGAEELRLDPARREAIRKAGRMPAAEEIVSMKPSRRWMRPVMVTGAAAALVAGAVWVMTTIPVEERPVAGNQESGAHPEIRFQVLLEPVPAPAPVGGMSRATPRAPAGGTDEDRRRVLLGLGRMLETDPEGFYRHAEKAAWAVPLADLHELPPLADNTFRSTRGTPRVRVPLVAGTVSFPIVERFVRGEDALPPKNAVRIEELVNHLDYEDEGDADLDGIRLGTELVRCPWDEKLLLLGILLRNESEAPLPESANLELQIKPGMVRSYRMLGFGSRTGGGDSPPALPRSLGAGESTYVLFELFPAREAVFTEHEVIVRAGLALDAPGADAPGPDGRRGLICPVSSPPRDWAAASGNFQTASVLAAFGMALRESPYRGTLDAEGLAELAERAMATARDAGLAHRETLQLVLDTVPLLVRRLEGETD